MLKKEVIAELEHRRWKFLPYAPNEWGWFKFDRDENIIAQGGSGRWQTDLAMCEEVVKDREYWRVRNGPISSN